MLSTFTFTIGYTTTFFFFTFFSGFGSRKLLLLGHCFLHLHCTFSSLLLHLFTILFTLHTGIFTLSITFSSTSRYSPASAVGSSCCRATISFNFTAPSLLLHCFFTATSLLLHFSPLHSHQLSSTPSVTPQ